MRFLKQSRKNTTEMLIPAWVSRNSLEPCQNSSVNKNKNANTKTWWSEHLSFFCHYILYIYIYTTVFRTLASILTSAYWHFLPKRHTNWWEMQSGVSFSTCTCTDRVSDRVRICMMSLSHLHIGHMTPAACSDWSMRPILFGGLCLGSAILYILPSAS